MTRRTHATLLSVLALILGSGALILTTAGTASADLPGTVTLTPGSGTLTDTQPLSQVSVSAPCPEHYQDSLNVLVAIPDFGDSLIAFGLTDGAPFDGSTITAQVPPAGPDGPPYVNTIADAFGNYGATPTDGVYAIKVECASADPAYTDTPTFSTLIEITGDAWAVKNAAPATNTSISVAAGPAGHTTVSKSFTLTATVQPSSAAGSVQFLRNGDTPIDTQPLTGGSATTTVPGISTASIQNYKAVFTPDDPAAFTASSSSTTTYAILNEPQLTALDDTGNTLDESPTLTAGQKVELTAEGFLPSATSAAGEPVTVTLDGAAGSLPKGAPDAQGTVSNYEFTVPSSLTDGAHALKLHGDTSAVDQTFAFSVGSGGDGSTAGDSSGSAAGSTAGDTGGAASGATAGSTSGAASGSGAGDGSSASGGSGSTGGGASGGTGDLSSGGASGGSSSGGGSGTLAATGAGGVASLGFLALLLLAGGGYAVHRVRRNGKLLSFGPTPRD
jgi:hypothetical protein